MHSAARNVQHIPWPQHLLTVVDEHTQPTFEDLETLVLRGMEVCRWQVAATAPPRLDLEHLVLDLVIVSVWCGERR